MSRDDTTSTESEVTADRESIERWAEEHDAVPVEHERDGETVVELVPESERTAGYEELTWDEFYQRIDRDDMVVVRRESDRRPFEVHERQDVLRRSSLEDEEIEQRLLEGETVTTTITETTVIEQTIVEEATIESEIVDRTMRESTIVDAELINREVDHCEVTNVEADDETLDVDMFETGHRVEDSVNVEVEVDEDWTVTKEVLEQLTIESRIVDTEATETETVESDTLEESVDVEGVQQTILESDMLESDVTPGDVIESGSIESRFREGDVIETMLLERKTVEEEVSLRKEFSGQLGGGTTVASETISSRTVESDIASDEDVEFVEVDREATTGTGTTTGGTETTGTAAAETAEGQAIPTQAEEGKTVVDATGEEVGMVVEVEDETVYVDPHPSLTDRIRAVLDWGGRDDDSYPLQSDHIATITDDEVQLTVDEDEETR